jgi:hypothetical protein
MVQRKDSFKFQKIVAIYALRGDGLRLTADLGGQRGKSGHRFLSVLQVFALEERRIHDGAQGEQERENDNSSHVLLPICKLSFLASTQAQSKGECSAYQIPVRQLWRTTRNISLIGRGGKIAGQDVHLHPAAIEMKERQRRVMRERALGQPRFQFGQYLLGHRMQVGEGF